MNSISKEKRKIAGVPCDMESTNNCIYNVSGITKKYSSLTNHETIVFSSIVYTISDSKYLFTDLDFDTSTTQVR